MNTLEICGALFLGEVALLIYVVVYSIVRGFFNKREKEKTYLEMMNLEATLKKKADEVNKNNPKSSAPVTPSEEIIESKMDNTDPRLNELLMNAATEGLVE